MNTLNVNEPVTRSGRMIIYTLLFACLLIALGFFWYERGINLSFFLVLLAVVLIPALWLMPVRVYGNDEGIRIKRLVGSKAIPLNRIKDVRVYETSMADGRICAVNGLYGAMGWFKSWDIGLYFAYIGNYKETFLIELKPDETGRERRYVISCRNHRNVVESLRRHLMSDQKL